MKRTISSILISTVAILAFETATVADDTFINAFNNCQKIKDRNSRLDCFDGLKPPQSIPTPGAKIPTRLEQEQAFGADTLKKRSKKAEASQIKSLTIGLIEAGKNKSGQYFFILDNGQVWRQLPADGGKLAIPKNLEGIEVTIKRKTLGSHTLRLKGRTIRVKRIK